MAKLAGVIIAACLVGFAVPVLIAQVNGSLSDEIVKAAGLGAVPTAVAGIAAMFVLRMLSRSTHEGVNIGTAVLACTLVRLFGSLAVGMLIFSAASPDKKPFVHAFLISSMIALMLETLILRTWSAHDGMPSAGTAAVGETSR